MWLDGFRWPGYNLQQRRGDYIRIAIPPTTRHDCPTAQMIQWTQAGHSDQDILDRIVHDDGQMGYSPSVLDYEEVRALARSSSEAEDDDIFQAIHSPRSTSSGWSSVPPGWNIDLQRIVDAEITQVCSDDPVELMVCTWLFDPSHQKICTQPKIAWIGNDPSAWEDELLHPERYQVVHSDAYTLTCVLPTPPKSTAEEHVAHILITLTPTKLEPILVSLEFQCPSETNVIVRFALLTPKHITRLDLSDMIPHLR